VSEVQVEMRELQARVVMPELVEVAQTLVVSVVLELLVAPADWCMSADSLEIIQAQFKVEVMQRE
jgi:hypothetical protein